MNDIYVLHQDCDLSAPKLNLYISSIDRFKLGCKTSGYSSNNIMTVPHIPAAAHGYVLLNVNPFHEEDIHMIYHPPITNRYALHCTLLTVFTPFPLTFPYIYPL